MTVLSWLHLTDLHQGWVRAGAHIDAEALEAVGIPGCGELPSHN
jgi:hypothetical protein